MEKHQSYRAFDRSHGLMAGRSWSELDAELVIAALSAALVVAGLLGQCSMRGMTLGLLGLAASLAVIIGWLRRPARDHD